MDSPQFRAHALRILNGIDTLISMFDDPDTLIEQLGHLTEQHKARPGVLQRHFDVSQVPDSAIESFNSWKLSLIVKVSIWKLLLVIH